jgi:hypothetical protein
MVVGATYVRTLGDAAHRRGMTVTAYCRRAIAAFVAADMGVDWLDLLADTPHPDGRDHGSYDPGTGHGSWTASPFTDDTSDTTES